jgi:hypothetical protein
MSRIEAVRKGRAARVNYRRTSGLGQTTGEPPGLGQTTGEPPGLGQTTGEPPGLGLSSIGVSHQHPVFEKKAFGSIAFATALPLTVDYWLSAAADMVPGCITHNWIMTCDQYIRLRQHYEAALAHWEHVLKSQGALENSPPAVVEMKKKALEERNAAEERMVLHQRTCPVCIPKVKGAHSSK